MAARRLGVLVALTGALVLLLGPTVNAWYQQRSDISDLRDEIQQRQAAVDDLTKRKAQWQDPAYVEQQARTRLKFVKVGETAYTVIDSEPEQDTGGLQLATVPDGTKRPWYGRMWSSAQTADAPAAAK